MRGLLTGFCNASNPPEIHARCTGAYDRGPAFERGTCACDCHVVEAVLLDTPTGYLVTEAPPETPEWFAARREGITGTDLPKILGITKYGNALSVWLDKRGELTDESGEAARWGQLLEETVAQEWAGRNDAKVEAVGVLAHVDEPWMRASLDRLVLPGTCPDGHQSCGLEVKTRSAFKAGSFRDDIPDDVLAQVGWGLLVSGLHHMHVAVLIGGQELRSFRVDRDEKLEEYLVGAAAPVWQAVLDGVPPEAHPDADGVLLDLLDKLYGRRAGEITLDAERAQEWLDQYAEGSELERSGKALKTIAKTGLVHLLGDGDTGVIDGRIAFTYRAPSPAPSLSAANLRALAQSSPEVYEALLADGFITITTPRPRFNVKEN